MTSPEKRKRRHWSVIPPVESVLYFAARAAFAAVQMFPWHQAATIGRWLGRVLRKVDRKHLRIARKNLERTRDFVAPAAEPEFLERMYDSLGLGLVELLMAPRILGRDRLSRTVRLERFEFLDRALRDGRGAILAVGHLGNYELAALAVAQAGYPLHSLYRPLPNRPLDRYLARCRARTGQHLIALDRGLREMVRVLRANEVLAVQMDLDAKGSGLFVEFMGRPASAHRTPATLSLRLSAPIILANTYREGRTHYCVLSEPLYPQVFEGGTDPVFAMTQEVVSQLEGFVRLHPDQWMWVLDRWRSAEKSGRPGRPG